MTTEEAIDRVMFPHTLRPDVPEDVEADAIALQAMGKRIAKKPTDMLCPGCGTDIKFMPLNKEAHPVTYCWLCGQAISWEGIS